jgi:hypothetical protein
MTLETKPTVYYAIRVFTQFEMDQAIEAEREACAKVARDIGNATEPDDWALDKCDEIETAIRARGNT